MSDYRDRDRNRNQDDRYPVARRESGQVGQNRYQQRERTPEEMARIRAARKREAIRRKKKKQRITIAAVIIIAVILIVVVVLIATGSNNDNKNSNNNNNTTAVAGETVADETATETTTEAVHAEVTLLSVGDVLMHTPLLNYADNWDGTYDFNSIFSQLTGEISAADIAICNQETPIDTESEPDGGINFVFNTPHEIGDAEINAGFDVVLQASNHSYDMGASGILNTIAYWKTRADEITMIGMNDSQEARDTIPIYEKNGIKFAMLNYTYGLNGFYMPDDMQYLVTLIDDDHYDIIVSDIQKAKEMADFVIIFPHWGTEDVVGYSTDFQDYWAKVFTEAGADLIIGTHPHVCEQIEWITADNGNKALCYFSLGNFASNQQELPEVLCGMAKVKIVKDGDKTYIDESSTGVIPVVTHNVNMGNFTNAVTVYRLSEYSNDLAYQHDIYYNYDSSFCKENLDALAYEIFGDWIIN